MSNRNPRERFDYKSWFDRNVAKRTVAALEAVAPRIADFAEREGLHAHARSVTIRYEK